MSILSRSELVAMYKSNGTFIEERDDLFKDAAENRYTKNGPFQQCSIDLHVGRIYVPETDPTNLGGAYNPKLDEHVLRTGHTVMIRTKEKLTLPNDIGGICFSPSRLALKAVLITNMGHVDPGYSGHLHFTAINMGKEPYTFRVSDIICSMIFFKLREDVDPFGCEHFTKINNSGVELEIPTVINNYYPKLAKDFVDVEKRAQTVAKDEFDKTKIWQIGVPVIAAVIALLSAVIPPLVNKPWEKEVYQLTSKIEALENKLDYESRIKDLENKMQKERNKDKHYGK